MEDTTIFLGYLILLTIISRPVTRSEKGPPYTYFFIFCSLKNHIFLRKTFIRFLNLIKGKVFLETDIF